MTTHTPLVVEVLRGLQIESQHSVSARVVSASGETIQAWGPLEKIFPRSSVKPLQALPLLLSGAAEKFAVSDIELTLACASHSGEKEHITAVENWLHRLGLTRDALECGVQIGLHGTSALHNNCSGKHTGMLATALALDVPTKGYIHTDHPIQKNIRTVLEDFCSEKITVENTAIDGCSIPTYAMSLHGLALAMARFGRDGASRKIFDAVVQNPFYLAGTNRYCTRLITAAAGNVLVKTGAEGVMMASVPGQQLGLVVKAHDGGVRAAEIAMSWILRDLGVLSPAVAADFIPVPVTNWNRIQTGEIRLGPSLA